ncbi:hypothetical protein RCC89_19435 [Cytophagaceae bacterium ABcell3]|nr:hypothetical protein RCC89_19435 [Cytophagaceae bacterium ABcell3]
MKYISLFFLIISFVQGCGSEGEKSSEGKKNDVKSNQYEERLSDSVGFFYEVQYAHFENEEVEKKGATSLNHFLEEVENFPWKEQLELAKKFKKTSPTLNVVDSLSQTELGISIVAENGYWLFYVPEINSEETFLLEVYSKEDVIDVINLYFNRDKLRLKERFNF